MACEDNRDLCKDGHDCCEWLKDGKVLTLPSCRLSSVMSLAASLLGSSFRDNRLNSSRLSSTPKREHKLPHRLLFLPVARSLPWVPRVLQLALAPTHDGAGRTEPLPTSTGLARMADDKAREGAQGCGQGLGIGPQRPAACTCAGEHRLFFGAVGPYPHPLKGTE